VARGVLPPPLGRAGPTFAGTRGSRVAPVAVLPPDARARVGALERTRERVLANLGSVRERISAACERCGRDPATVRLVVIGKGVEPHVISWIREAGVVDLGENYVRELRLKRELIAGCRWHFVGTLQRGSAHHVAELADVVHTVVPGTAFARLQRGALARNRSIPALVEVDFTGERAGVAPADVVTACDEVAGARGVRLVGLMTVPPLTRTAEEARPFFRRLTELLAEVAKRHPQAVELSMGMSLDYEVAVEEGATMVRLGTALFGPRRQA
jgi:pyridoxal phosphate enzyme (YggS family)